MANAPVVTRAPRQSMRSWPPARATSGSVWSVWSAFRCAKAAPSSTAHGHKLGVVTSGTLAPTVDQPIAMAYLPIDHSQSHHEVHAIVRGKSLPMRVTPMPFAPHRYVPRLNLFGFAFDSPTRTAHLRRPR